MRRFHATSRGFSMIELSICVTIFCIVALTGMTALWIGWRSTRDVMRAGTVYQDAFWAMNAIEENVERCHTINVPDPNEPAPSIQLLVPQQLANGTGPSGTYLSYEYWLNTKTNNLMMNNGNGAVTIFGNVTAFAAVIRDAPTNSVVQLTCTCNAAGTGTETVTVTTMAHRRN